ncbi:lichenan operon transcriptional antiterminator [Spiroplasma clarkii]|uniref:Lichenan operon transcriptional antiterminator n=2 Tax=Spiroplasma clarkii TaxID=2139 RepID=A0A2K8KPR6_9MOLU|nr:lichenan operon transcriptional antiterminator [Spiroplasma clarkii]
MRIDQILKELMTNGCLDIQTTINKWNISERTLRTDILRLKSKYQIEITKQGNYYILDHSISLHHNLTHETVDYNDKNQRIYWIVQKLFETNEVYVDQVFKSLYINFAVLKDDIKTINQNFVQDIIKFEQDQAGNKLILINSEQQKRKLFENYLVFNDEEYFKTQLFFRDLVSQNRQVSLYSLNEFVKIFYIMIHRILKNQIVKFDNFKNMQIEENNLLTKILDYISQEWNLQLPVHEIYYLEIKLMSYKLINSKIVFDLEKKLDNFLISNLQVNQINKSEVYKNLLQHIEALIIRYSTGIEFKNPYIDQIKNNYPWQYDTSIKLAKFLEAEFNLKNISEQELGFLAIHISLLEINSQQNQQFTSYLISDEKNVVSNILLHKITSEIQQLNKIQLISSVQLQEIELDKNDFLIIVGDQNINHINKIYIDPIITNKTIEFIKTKLNQKNINNNLNQFQKFYIQVNKIQDNLEAINLIVEKLNDQPNIKQKLLSALIEREQKSSTYIGDFTAIPHAETELVLENDYNLFFFKNGIMWKKRIVYFVFLININTQHKKNYRPYFETIVEFKKNVNEKMLKTINSEDDLNGI